MDKYSMKDWITILLGVVILSACGGAEILAETESPDGSPMPVQPVSDPVESATPTESPSVMQPPVAPENTATLPPRPEGPTLPRLESGATFVLKRVHMLDGLNGWGVAESAGHEHLLRTWDGGLTWRDESPPEPLPESGSLLLQASYLDNLTAWVTYYPQERIPAGGWIWSTSDGGFEWKLLTPFPLGILGDYYRPWMVFVDPMTGGFLAEATTVGAGIHFKTSYSRTFDGGTIWQFGALSKCQVTGYTMKVSGVGWVTESCLGPYDNVDPTFWLTQDNGVTWSQNVLPLNLAEGELPEGPLFCTSHSPNFTGNTSGVIAVTCYENELAIVEVLNIFYQSSDDGKTFDPIEVYPGGSVFMTNPNVGWAFGREIYQTLDGGRAWIQIKSVAWDGTFSFIDRWRGWAVAVAGEEVALVRSLDSGRTWEIVETQLEQPPPEEPCILSVNSSQMSYLRPSFASDTFGEMSPGLGVYASVRTADGWIGFSPGVAQAANMGVFRHRWFPPNTDVVYEGDCAGLPVVEGPEPRTCYTMPMGHVPVYAAKDTDSTLLVTLTSDEYAAVLGLSADDMWLRVDLGRGNTGLNLEGWMERFHANFNGPCDLPVIP